MTTAIRIVALVLAALPAEGALGGPSHAQLDRMAHRYTVLNNACRGGAGSEEATDKACKARDAISRPLDRAHCFPFQDADTLGDREQVKCPWMKQPL